MTQNRRLERRIANIKTALRAREFTAQETLEMGIDLIEFALNFNKEAKMIDD